MTSVQELERLIDQAEHAIRAACAAHFEVMATNLQAAKIQDDAASRLVSVHRTQCRMLIASLLNHLRDVEPTDGT